MAAVSIRNHELENETHNLYDITFYTTQIHTLLTHSPSLVDQWISQTHQIHRRTSPPSIVGLDVEWRPNFSRNIDNPIAIIQLCVGSRCLIFQILHSPNVPLSLTEFLRNEGRKFVFVGVGIENDVEKMLEDYELGVGNTADLRGIAAEKMGVLGLKNAGLKELTRVVLGKEVEKPKKISMSRWDYIWLTDNQVQYACLDAYLSCAIGETLFSSSSSAPSS
ncbi:Polynucleotidyl transferase ribonuclease H-like superfamily protein [Euphorbia peplus]|nr:Polynucleotidyl transferase ribonuclease H-like superfamily protein [Euphorbia peplus]